MAGSLVNFVKTILAPLLLALAIYLVLTFALLPLYRRHRQRYSQYLPLNSISNAGSSTSSFLRERILAFLFLPSTWAFRRRGDQRHHSSRRRSRAHATPSALDGDDGDSSAGSIFGSDEGEDMVGFDVDHDAQRRRGVDGRDDRAGHPLHGDSNLDQMDSTRRLSVELEQGFRDDSDSSDGENGRVTAGRRVMGVTRPTTTTTTTSLSQR